VLANAENYEDYCKHQFNLLLNDEEHRNRHQIKISPKQKIYLTKLNLNKISNSYLFLSLLPFLCGKVTPAPE
jgi:hypothetical protein